MKYKCYSVDLDKSSLVEYSITVRVNTNVVYVTDFTQRAGYYPVSDEEVAFVESRTGRKWIDVRERCKDNINKACNQATANLTGVTNTVEWINWQNLVTAAKEHSGARFSNDAIPDVIAAYAMSKELRPRAASEEILRRNNEVSARLNNLSQIRLMSIADMNDVAMDKLQARYEKILDDIRRTGDFFP